MNTKAQAVFIDFYEISNDYGESKQMVTIQLSSDHGKPLQVLQSENNPPAIEYSIRNSGWNIASWTDEAIYLTSHVYHLGHLKTANAEISKRYTVTENGHVRNMAFIQLTSHRGDAWMVLQSEDNPVAIENVLRLNRYNVTSWIGDNLVIAYIQPPTVRSHSSQQQGFSSQGQPQKIIIERKTDWLSCSGCLGIMVIIGGIMAIISAASGAITGSY